MRQWICGLTIGLLLLGVGVLALIAFTPLGIPLRYEAQAPVYMGAFEAIIASEKSCFGPLIGGHGGGGTTWGPSEQSLYRTSHQAGPIFDAEEEDYRVRLLKAVKQLNDLAMGQGFGLLPGGIEYASFGPKGGPDTGFVAPFAREGLDRKSSGSGELSFRANDRFCLVSLTYAARKNLACHFRWTLILDSQTGDLKLLAQYFGQSPVFAGPGISSLDRIEFAPLE